MRQAELFGICRALGVLGDTELARKWEKLNKPARTFCARLWVKASPCRSNSALSRDMKRELCVEKPHTEQMEEGISLVVHWLRICLPIQGV